MIEQYVISLEQNVILAVILAFYGLYHINGVEISSADRIAHVSRR